MIDIAPDDLVACICEGASEMAILQLLLERNLLCFTEKQLLTNTLLPPRFYRRKEAFQNELLTLDYEGRKIVVLVIQDRDTTYRIASPYDRQVKAIHSILTRPELEILMVHALKLDRAFEKSKIKKPSEFLQEHLSIKCAKIKSQNHIRDFYGTHDLIEAITRHKQVKQPKKGHFYLADILR